MVVGYTSYVLLVYSADVVLGVLAFVYLFYIVLAALMYAEYWLLYSERKRQDLRLAWLLLVFPAFTFVTRCWNAVATLNELLTKSHLESAMAPSGSPCIWRTAPRLFQAGKNQGLIRIAFV